MDRNLLGVAFSLNQKMKPRMTNQRTRSEPADPASLERGVRQLLADKVSGNLVFFQT